MSLPIIFIATTFLIYNTPTISTFSSSSIKELLSLSNGDLYSMDKIHWWLLKHKESYAKLKDEEQSKYITQLEDGSVVRLPPLQKPNEDQIFLCIYEALDILSNFHRNEEYFQRELARHKSILVADTLSLKNWVADNEKIGADNYACFLLDYLDYSDTPEHLGIFFLYSKDLNFYVNKGDFKYTLEFLEVFQDHYWDQDILQRFNDGKY